MFSVNKIDLSKAKFTNLGISATQTAISANPNSKTAILSNKSKHLLKKMDSYIEDTWTNIKNGKTTMNSPTFYVAGENKRVASIKPVYQGSANHYILFEIDNHGSLERIMFKRENPEHYHYEKIIPTAHGSATTRTFSTEGDRNSEIESTVNEYVETFFPQVFPRVRKAYKSLTMDVKGNRL